MFKPMAHHPHNMASGLASLGRGGDSMLVHMSPGEVQSLHQLATLAGGGITTNPRTGLPEAGFLSSLLPMLAGGLATVLSGGTLGPLALMALQGGAGLAAGAVKGDKGIGLIGDVFSGIGGGGLASGVENLGASAASQTAAASALGDQTAAANAAAQAASDAPGAIMSQVPNAATVGDVAPSAATNSAMGNLAEMNTPGAAGRWAAMKAGMSALGPGGSASGLGFLQSNVGNIMKAAAPALMGGLSGGTSNLPTSKAGPYYNTTFTGKMTYGPGGQPLYSGSYSPGSWSTNYMGQGYRPSVGAGQNTSKGPLGSFENPYSGITTLYPTYDPNTGLPTGQAPGMKRGGHVHHYAAGGASVPSSTGQQMLDALKQNFIPAQGTDQAALQAMNQQFAASASAPRPAPADPTANNAYLSALAATPYNPNWAGPTPAPTSTSTQSSTSTPSSSYVPAAMFSTNASGNTSVLPQYTYDPTTGTYTQVASSGAGDIRGGGYNSDILSGRKANFAGGGLADLAPTYAAGGKLLTGDGNGMSDSIPAVIHGPKPQRAALADGEFVVPADVVSHLGNGSTSAGAKKLYSMMNKIRLARTGNLKQGKQINPDKFLPV